eukprot:TRINITY_DN25666_c0_g1_i4.p1 TRINITY_DN25666_c0_g1~~TRINITY_DN25666_c0_g1_i4.p1  ORF type:complete len:395 (+),score=99.83 TRINITY_DN25666_c0_g1_i4:107-1291(+)
MYLSMTYIERLRYQLQWDHIECPSLMKEEGWNPFPDAPIPASQDKPRFIIVNKSKLLRDVAYGIVRYCCAGDAPSLHPVDIWCITVIDLHKAGYLRDVAVGEDATSVTDSYQEWSYAYPVDTRLVPQDWGEKRFWELCTDRVEVARGEGPTTTKAFGRQSRFGGENVIVYGQGFTDTTKIIFDWPYGGNNGWSVTVKPEAVYTTALITTAPPMADVLDSGSIKVFLLATDTESNSRESGDAACSYECEGGEEEVMKQGILQLLLQSDDYDIHPFTPGPPSMPMRRSESISSAVDVLLPQVSEKSVLEHMESRRKAGNLFSLLTLTDGAGRNILHYVCRLAWQDVLQYCVKNDGRMALGVQDNGGFMPVHFAAVVNSKPFFTYLASELTDMLAST